MQYNKPLKDEQFKKIITAYLTYYAVMNNERLGMPDLYKELELEGKELTKYRIRMLDAVCKMLNESIDIKFNYYNFGKIKIICNILYQYIVRGKTLTADKQQKINLAFFDMINQYKFIDFCEMIGLERKQFKSVKYDDNYCEIFLEDIELNNDPIMIYAGDYISRKKMFDEPTKTFEISVDGEDITEYYMSLMFKDYYPKFLEQEKNRLNNKKEDKNEK